MTNPTRKCIACEQTDDHPRHVAVAPDGSDIPWHMDCHVLATSCPICMEMLSDAPAKAKGDTLREHLMKKPPKDHTEHLVVTGE